MQLHLERLQPRFRQLGRVWGVGGWLWPRARVYYGGGGLSVSDSGFTLVPVETTLPAGGEHDLRFRVLDATRQPVTGYEIVHDKPMHLIVARRDLRGYQHLHPTMAADGTWSVPLTLPEPGVYRAYADFTVTADGSGGIPVTLGVDLIVNGDYQSRPLPSGKPARCCWCCDRGASTSQPTTCTSAPLTSL